MVRIWLPHLGPSMQNPVSPFRFEAIRLFRHLFIKTRDFTWNTDQGVPWRDVLRASIKQEFQAAKEETDPHIIASLIADARDYMMQIDEKLIQGHSKLFEHFEKTRNRQ